MTGTGSANTLNGEANLTFDSSLVITKSEGAANSLNDQISLKHTSGTTGYHIKTIRAAASDNPDGIAFVENTTESMRIRGGKVHIGNTFTADGSYDNLVVGTGSGNEGMTIYGAANGASSIAFADPNDNDVGNIMYDHSSNFMRFVTNAGERMRISDAGIHIGGTGAANALDDYEEGTWTPAFYTYSGVTTSSITNNLATYTKIGNIVHIHANIDVTLSSLPGQTVIITGLPFAASNAGATGQRAIIALGGDTSNTGAYTSKAHFRTNGSQLEGLYYNASNNTAYWNYSSMDSPTFALHIHGFYTV
jgi:hypothetical protein